MSQNRKSFRSEVFSRDSHNCVVPWCKNKADDTHHIIERSLWGEGGYITENGVSVCNKHHKYAEENDIPPQAFWKWLNITDPVTPKGVDFNCDKWGKPFDTPPWESLRNRIKYPSSRHLLPLYWYDENSLAEDRVENDDTGLETIEDFLGKPLVITHKIDGSNCMMVSDIDNPVRARNGSSPEETMKPLYKQGGLYWRQKVHDKLPENLQVFGEWCYCKHNIHYGCECDTECEDTGPNLSELTGFEDEKAYFQIFGVYDKIYNLWLSWPETKRLAKKLGFPTTPEIYVEDNNDNATFEKNEEGKNIARNKLINYAREVIDNGGEGIVVRTKYPFHYGQFSRRIGKYVRENHVKNNKKHWKYREKKTNKIKNELPDFFGR